MGMQLSDQPIIILKILFMWIIRSPSQACSSRSKLCILRSTFWGMPAAGFWGLYVSIIDGHVWPVEV